MDIDEPATSGNANGKRKSRSGIGNGKSYKEASEEDDEEAKPLVRCWRRQNVKYGNDVADS